MKEVFKGLWVGNEDDVSKAKEKGFAILSACKDGATSHRSLLQYHGMSAPKGAEYLVARRPKHLYLNLIDGPDPAYVPDKVIDAALNFITEHLDKNDPVLVHCVEGHSRAPSLAFLWLYLAGKLPLQYHQALRQFRMLYPDYLPALGMKLKIKDRIAAAKSRR